MFTVTIEPTIAYEHVWFYYIIDVVNLPHVSFDFCGHLQGGVLSNDIAKPS